MNIYYDISAGFILGDQIYSWKDVLSIFPEYIGICSILQQINNSYVVFNTDTGYFSINGEEYSVSDMEILIS